MSLTDLEKKRIEYTTNNMRKDIVELCYMCGEQKGHLGGCMSAVELLAVLYLKTMNVSTLFNTNNWDHRDRFVMSKGHAGIALYAALKQAGILTDEQLKAGIRGEETILYRHPKYNPQYGIECSVGSLGMGVGFAVGLSEVAKRQNKNYKVYSMLGDGECDEGSVWESLAYAAHRKLDNFVVIVDRNGLQLDGKTEDVLDMSDLAKKIESFGYKTIVIDGHNISEIYDAMNTPHEGMPLAIVANTVKGKGISFAENKVEWHDNLVTEELYNIAMSELNSNSFSIEDIATDDRVIDNDIVCDVVTKGDYRNIIEFNSQDIEQFTDLGYRNIVGYISEMLADEDSKFSLVYSDCANRIGINKLINSHPEMCYEMGIAEQNQLMVATALALEGFDVFAVAYAPFITARVLDQIRANLGYMKSPVKLIGLSAGYAASDLGSTHTALEDIANLRGIPNMTVICPADCTEIAKTMLATVNMKTPVYIRLTNGLENKQKIYDADYDFEIGKAITLAEGDEVALIGCGAILKQVMDVRDILESKGISCKVINMHTIKPLDIKAIDAVKDMKLIVTIEEHSVIGGLGSAVSEYLCSFGVHAPLLKLGVPDSFYVADLPIKEMERAGLTVPAMVDKICNSLNIERK